MFKRNKSTAPGGRHADHRAQPVPTRPAPSPPAMGAKRPQPARVRPSAAGADVSTAATAAPSGARSRDGWIPPGVSVEVGSVTLRGGLYVGKKSRAANGQGVEPALINPELRVDYYTRPDWNGSTVGYCPSYDRISPGARAAYLSWLAGGRQEPNVPISWVFLFFDGLERRVMVDATKSGPARDELPVIHTEVVRLLGLYARNGSVRSYATEFLAVLDPERAELIRWAFQTYAKGEWTLNGLAKELELRGLINTPTPKYPLRPVRSNHLYMMLTHPYYKGDVVWRGARSPGRHPQLVDEATWTKVQDMLQAHGPGEKQREHPHYLKSTVYCGRCGSRLVITNTKNRYGVVHPYFVCVGRHQKRTTCTRKATLISVVEELIEDFYADVQLDDELRQTVETVLGHELQATRQQAESLQRELTEQQQRLVHERTRLLQAHYAGAVPLELLKTEQNRISSQLETIESRLEATVMRFDTIGANLKRALDFASSCHRHTWQPQTRPGG